MTPAAKCFILLSSGCTVGDAAVLGGVLGSFWEGQLHHALQGLMGSLGSVF